MGSSQQHNWQFVLFGTSISSGCVSLASAAILFMHKTTAGLRPTKNMEHSQAEAVPITVGFGKSEATPLLSPVVPPSPRKKAISVVALTALVFFNVSGGPIGSEGLVRAGGPFWALAGLVFFPIFWSLPVALMTAELSTAFPQDGGYVLWVRNAFGHFWAFQEAWWSWSCGSVDNALYPGMLVAYLQGAFGAHFNATQAAVLKIGSAFTLAVPNMIGLDVVGNMSVGLGVLVMLPFAIMFLLSVPTMRPGTWFQTTKTLKVAEYVNVMAWNLNGWDSVSTIAGEVEDASRAFPRALMLSVVLIAATYILPILASTSLEADWSVYNNGLYTKIAQEVGGDALAWLMGTAVAFSCAGLFVAELTTDAYQIAAMGDSGSLPAIIGKRNRYDTPGYAIGMSLTVIMLLAAFDFTTIIAIDNYLYALALLLEVAAFIKLRISRPDLPRPYKMPGGTIGVSISLIFPCAVAVFMLVSADALTHMIGLSAVGVGLVAWPLIKIARKNEWVDFQAFPIDQYSSDVLAMGGTA